MKVVSTMTEVRRDLLPRDNGEIMAAALEGTSLEKVVDLVYKT